MHVIHIANNSKEYPNKFVPSYSNMVFKEFNESKHEFYYMGDDYLLDDNVNVNVIKKNASSLLSLLSLLSSLRRCDKIVMHSLPSGVFLVLFFLISRFFAKKLYITLWGGEVHNVINKTYRDKVNNYLNKGILRKSCGFITYLQNDYKLAMAVSGNLKARWVNIGGFYPSNFISNDYKCNKKNVRFQKILIGASAFPRNNHADIIEILSKVNLTNKDIYIPLSYGDNVYAKQVSDFANQKIGAYNKIHSMYDFYSIEEYTNFLSTIDVAIFAHLGQQAMGNIISLLGSGAKVYLNKDSDSWKYLRELNFDVFDFEKIELSFFDNEKNIKLANELFSYDENVKKQKEFYFF